MANNFDRAILDGTNMAANTLHSLYFAQLPQQQKLLELDCCSPMLEPHRC